MGGGALELFGMMDIFLAVLVIGLQGAYWVLGYTGFIINVASGVWGMIIFILTGVYACRNAPRNSIKSLAASSVCVGLTMIILFSYGANELRSYEYCEYFAECNNALIITIIFLTAGCLAVFVNVVLFILAYKLPITSPLPRNIPPTTQWNVINPGATNPGHNPGTWVYFHPNGAAQIYQVAAPSTDSPAQQYQQNPPPPYQPNEQVDQLNVQHLKVEENPPVNQ